MGYAKVSVEAELLLVFDITVRVVERGIVQKAAWQTYFQIA